VAPIDVRGAAGESAPAEFVVLQAVQVGMQTLGCAAFSQVDKDSMVGSIDGDGGRS
jgi:hypothetical protein